MDKNRRQDYALRHAVNGLNNLLVQDADVPILSFCDCFIRGVVQLCEARFGVLFVEEEQAKGWRYVAGWVPGVESLSVPLREAFIHFSRHVELPKTVSVWPEEHVKDIAKGTSGQVHENDVIYSFPVISEAEHTIAILVIIDDGILTTLESLMLRLKPLCDTFARLMTPSLRTSLAVTTFFESHALWLRRVFDNAFEGILIIDQNEKILFCNAALCLMLQIKERLFVGKLLAEVLECKVHRAIMKLLNEAKEQGSATRKQSTLALHGVDLPETTLRIRFHEVEIAGRPCFTLLFVPVRGFLNSRDTNKFTGEQFGVLTRLAPVGIMQVDNQWNCIYVNDQLCDFTGMQPEEFYGIHWIDVIHRDETSGVLEQIRYRLSQGDTYEGRYRLCSPLGVVTWVKCRAKALYDASATVDGFIATFTDITDQLRLENSLRKMSETDTLTGLMNRRYFLDHAQGVLRSRRIYNDFALLYIDLDGFKQINDTLGHDRGDLLLKEAALRLKRSLREADAVARLGGDEFVVLMRLNNQQDDVYCVADKLIQAMSTAFVLVDQHVYVTASIGIAIAESGSTKTLDQIMKQADLALYHAKDAGRNNYQVYSKRLSSIYSRKSLLKSDLQTALDHDQFYLMFQPTARVENGSLFTIEALLRWRHPTLGLISPVEFIPLLEESGFIHNVGLWVFMRACQTWREWVDSGIMSAGVGISINVSPIQMRSQSFVEECGEIIVSSGTPANAITLEITESTLLENIERSAGTLERLRALGVRVALDDFGAGYTSIAYLNRYPIDVIKIDKGFVSRCGTRQQERIICKSIIELAHDLELIVIAEGVEHELCFDTLKKLRCDVVQGYLVTSALSVAKCARWLKSYAVTKIAVSSWGFDDRFSEAAESSSVNEAFATE